MAPAFATGWFPEDTRCSVDTHTEKRLKIYTVARSRDTGSAVHSWCPAQYKEWRVLGQDQEGEQLYWTEI